MSGPTDSTLGLDSKAFGLAAGIVAVVLFVVCAIAVALAPGATAALGEFLLHADLSGFTRTLTWGNFLGGTLGWGAGTTVVFTLVAALYNRLSSRARV
jgi:hypothetical protein